MSNQLTKEWSNYNVAEGYVKRAQDIELKNGDIVYNCYPNAGVWNVLQKGKNQKYYGKEIPVSETVATRLTREHSFDND